MHICAAACAGLVLLAPRCRWPPAQPGLPGLHQHARPPAAARPIRSAVQTLLLLTALTFLPAALLMMTSFTRIIIVLSLLRQALGTQTAPPNQVLVGLALFLTLFVMGPVFDKIYTEAYQPLSGKQDQDDRRRWTRASRRCKAFMMRQTRAGRPGAVRQAVATARRCRARKTCRCAS